MYGIFFCDLKSFFAVLQKFQTFLKEYSADFQKNDTNGKTGGSFMCLLILLISLNFNPRSTAFETIGKVFFDMFLKKFLFIFSKKTYATFCVVGFSVRLKKYGFRKCQIFS